MVACSECRSVVPQSETVYSNSGDLLCSRCGSFDAAHAQVERARQAAHEASSHNRGAVGMIIGAVERAAADRRAGQMHSELLSIAVTAPAQQAAAVPCDVCKTVVPRAETTLTLQGEPMCRSCAATYDAAAERRRMEGSLVRGFLMGFFLSIVGIGAAYALNRGPAEKKGAAIGAVISFGLVLILKG